VNSVSSAKLEQHAGLVFAKQLSIALIGPNEPRRWDVSSVLAEYPGIKVREFSSYPTALDSVSRLLPRHFDIIIVDLDSDPKVALDLVESIRGETAVTVIVYSEKADPELMACCMRAGVREYLVLPVDQSTLDQVFARARIGELSNAQPAPKAPGDLLVFFGAKGGAGVTTIACNLAIALAQDADRSALLIDLAVPLGDAALNLGIAAKHSTEDALREADGLDASLLLSFLDLHRSGVSVLAAPSDVPKVEASKAAVDKLLAVARQQFSHVIVDVGSRTDLMGTDLFDMASTVYLVTQAGISDLRNSNRLISQFFSKGNPKLEIVLNRFESHSAGVNEDVITKALGRPVRWKIPDDQAATRRMQSTAGALSPVDSPMSRLILEMAAAVMELPADSNQEKEKLFVEEPSVHEEPLVNDGLDLDLMKQFAAAENPRAAAEDPPIDAAPAPSLARVAPAIEWPAPDPIAYGVALSAAQLNATASVQGTLVYTPGRGYVLPAGTHTLWVTFLPTNSGDGASIQAAVSIVVSKTRPAVSWPAPPEIACGSALNGAHLNATASVPGSFTYTPAAGEVLAEGTHTLSVTFTPADNANYTRAEAAVPVTVSKTTPDLAWPAPDPITFGTALDAAQLNATAPVPGSFTYTPPAGEVLAAGMHTLSVSFTPADSANYTAVEAAVPVTVFKSTPALGWPAPDPITFGTGLGAAQLNATASVPGSFTYTPHAGEVLAAGTHTLSVSFAPADEANYSATQASVKITVGKATPVIAWPEPDPIPYGATLATAQLNAKTPVPGTFSYIPSPGAALAAGEHKPSVIFTPADISNYTTAEAAVRLTVTKAVPAIAWPSPDPIFSGAALGAAQLNATANVPGTFDYTPAAGELLPPGTHTLSLTFTPVDSLNYTTAQATASMIINEKTPTAITWAAPSAIAYGTPLGAAQFNATASAPGTFVYAPAAGDVLAPGRYTLSAAFTPADSEKYAAAQATVALDVEELPHIASPLEAPAENSITQAVVDEYDALADFEPQKAADASSPGQPTERETRTYKGAIYERGGDGQWHLQKN
jgi:Flp pilus assembly CpaE family ATPase